MRHKSTITGAVLVLVTCPNRQVGEKIADALVREKLAACINIVPRIISISHWEGKLSRESEALLLIKTVRRRLASLTARIKALHPYVVPEIIATPLIGGSTAYLEWVVESTS